MRLTDMQRGDTIIEVMVAFSVFAMVAVGALTVMNQGTAGAQNTLETTLVRQEIDNQAEMLRFLHQAYIANPSDTTGGPSTKFATILARATLNPVLTQPSRYGDACTQSLPGDSNKRFVLNTAGDMISSVRPIYDLDVSTRAPYAQLADSSTSYGMWIEPVVSNANVASGTTRFIDFHVRSCWESPSSGPQRTLGTIIRLYVPENVQTGTAAPGASTIPLTSPTYFQLAGSSATECTVHNTTEINDETGGTLPAWAPFANLPSPNGVNTSGTAQACVRGGARISHCSNYDVRYRPNIPATSAGTYSLVLSYGDQQCGYGPISSNFTFKGAVYVNGAIRTTFNLNASVTNETRISQKLNVGSLNAGDAIEIRWWNNHFFGGMLGIGTQDPDFFIDELALNKEGP